MNAIDPHEIERHVEFSFRQIENMASLIQRKKQDYEDGKLAPGEWSAYVESFAIHTRLLYSFFYERTRYADDVIATDFVPDWDARRPKASQELVTWAKERANKQVAHMTKARLSYPPPEYDWPVGLIANELAACRQMFISLSEQQGHRFQNSPSPPRPGGGWSHDLMGRTS
jgi:hypothetical protein